MHIVVCVDNAGGMMFFKKRQSRDRALNEYLLKKYGTVYVNAYSAKIFEGGSPVEAFPDNGVCFVENIKPSSLENVERVTLCKWNRDYPADMFFDIDISGYRLDFTEDIVGSSHEKITIEEYTK